MAASRSTRRAPHCGQTLTLAVVNGDLYDAGMASKFSPMLYGDSVPMSEELLIGRQVLAEMGVKLSLRQMQRAAEQDAQGRRKLPFFVDPIEHKLKIEKENRK